MDDEHANPAAIAKNSQDWEEAYLQVTASRISHILDVPVFDTLVGRNGRANVLTNIRQEVCHTVCGQSTAWGVAKKASSVQSCCSILLTTVPPRSPSLLPPAQLTVEDRASYLEMLHERLRKRMIRPAQYIRPPTLS